MGIDKANIRILLKTLKNKKTTGKCITFGVQGIEGKYNDIVKLFNKEKHQYFNISEDKVTYDPKTQFGSSIHQDVFFKMLGYSQVDSLDYYPDENPTYVLDLNKPIDDNLCDKYDFVHDGGTLEHCFNTFEILKNVVKLLKVGGFIMHQVPVSGMINHGFYQFSPTLFFDFYKANGFIDLKCKIRVTTSVLHKSYCFDYLPGDYLPASFGDNRVDITFFATKSTKKDDVIIPNQSFYLDLFENHSNRNNGKIGLRGSIIRLFKPFPFLYNIISYIYKLFMKIKIKKCKL